MLNKLSAQIRNCLEHAEHCASKAAAQLDGSALKQDYLKLEENWRSLAQSMQLSEQLTDFTNESVRKRKSSTLITPFLRDQAFDPETLEAMGQAFVTTCERLGLSERDDALTQLVAHHIVELAQRGLKNPTELHLAAIKTLSPAAIAKFNLHSQFMTHMHHEDPPPREVLRRINTPAQCLEFATECNRLASVAKTGEHHKKLQEMARAWAKAAEEAEQ